MDAGPANDVSVESHIPGAMFSINGCPTVENASGRYFSRIPLSIRVILPKGVSHFSCTLYELCGDAVKIGTSCDITINTECKTRLVVK